LVTKVKKLTLFLFYHGVMLLLSWGVVTWGYARIKGVPFNPFTLETVFVVFFSLVCFFFLWKDLYRHPYSFYLRMTLPIVIRDILLATGITFLVILGVLLADSSLIVSRLKLGTLLLLAALVFYSLYLLQYFWVLMLSRLGLFHKRVLIIGNPDDRLPINALFQDAGETKELVGSCRYQKGEWVLTHEDGTLSTFKYLNGLFFREQISEVIICLGREMKGQSVAQLTSFCRENMIGYYLVPDMGVLPRVNHWRQKFPYIPLIERFSTNQDSLLQISLKRVLDVVFSSLVLLAFLPAWLIIVIAIKLEDGGPSLYVSERVGKNGKPIRFYKFRSMVMNAEELKEQLLHQNERKDGPLFKIKNDPRITKVGRFLRKYSLDEIPQFLNVLRGDMSIVGPRPHLPSEVAHYVNEDYLRLECVPGITCFPQVMGRNDISFREWVDMDIEYRKKWNFFLDIKLICMTAGVVLKPLFRDDACGH